MRKTALIIVDVQNDFLPPNGALAVPHGTGIIPYINALFDQYTTIVATKDWHPVGHVSFASTHNKDIGSVIEVQGTQQILWPDHCVQNKHGAELACDLDITGISKIIEKGTNKYIDSYSGFFDNNKQKKTELDAYLKQHVIDTVHICGLATDYCVKFTACDAARLGYTTAVLRSGCRAVNLNPNDEEQAFEEMSSLGITVVE